MSSWFKEVPHRITLPSMKTLGLEVILETTIDQSTRLFTCHPVLREDEEVEVVYNTIGPTEYYK